MDARVDPIETDQTSDRPSRAEAEKAVETLLRWIGEDPSRGGLIDTPRRVLDSYAEVFGGYGEDADALLARTFDESGGYDGMVVLRDIPFRSHCEHHMLPILGRADIAYVPNDHVVGLSKLSRVVEAYARRLQIQERLTSQIAQTIQDTLAPRGVAVRLVAEHLCMSMRGIRQPGRADEGAHVGSPETAYGATAQVGDEQVEDALAPPECRGPPPGHLAAVRQPRLGRCLHRRIPLFAGEPRVVDAERPSLSEVERLATGGAKRARGERDPLPSRRLRLVPELRSVAHAARVERPFP